MSAVYTAPPRSSFIAALKDIPEAWEITVENRKAKVRRMATDTLLDDFFFDPGYQHLIVTSRINAALIHFLDPWVRATVTIRHLWGKKHDQESCPQSDQEKYG